ncbi:LysR family transcriptional regulator [Psychrobacter sp. CAL346-MNA-CIBAN-0220]|uniref:LysR family transcriptional regulator n=1 Tax=Psychrobacter sp. CAL346-MNA-CIBAN-0220 TaxID=3140457 RepID=UPI003327AA5C
MHWDDLAYFISLVEKQTLTACAEKIGVQHSTVARRIEHLEQTLKVKLFDRMGKRYILTQEGELLYIQATEVQKEITVFERMAIDQNAMQGKVVVSAPPVWANEVLMPSLISFRQQFPDILLEICGEVGVSNLHQREADIALRLHRPTQEDLIIRMLGEVRYGFFAHCDYIEHNKPEQWQLIEFQANSRVLAWTQMLIEHHSYTIAFSTNDLYVAYNAACEKLGIALLPYFLASQNPKLLPVNPVTRISVTYEKLNTLLTLDPLNPPLKNEDALSNTTVSLTQSYTMYLVMHPDVRRSARVRAVADWLITTTAHLN